MNDNETRERLAQTWNASAASYARLADRYADGSYERKKYLSIARYHAALASELRQSADTFRQVGDFYRQAAIDHLNKAVEHKYDEHLAMHHLGIAEKFMDRAEAL